MLNSMCGDGQVQFYQNTATAEEMVYQTTGAKCSEDVSGAGISVNLIPKRGANNFNGSVTAMGAIGNWQADNLTQDLINRGLKATDKIDHNYDVEGGQGGRLIRDKLWFFGSGRRISVNSPIADTFCKDGRRASTISISRAFNCVSRGKSARAISSPRSPTECPSTAVMR